MLKRKSIYPIGIDIDNSHIYAAQLKENSDGFKIRGLLRREVNGAEGEEGNESLVQPLKEISRYKGFRGRRAVVHLPAKDIISFPVRLKPERTESIEDAILRESTKYIPFPVEEAMIDYPSISDLPSGGVNEFRGTIIAVRRKNVTELLQVLSKTGFSVEAVDSSVSSLTRLHRHMCEFTDNVDILCHIGYEQSLLTAVTKEDILFERRVEWGTKSLLKRVCVNLEHLTDEGKAEILLQKYGLLYEERDGLDEEAIANETNIQNTLRSIFQIISPYIDELVHEFHKLIGYIRSEGSNQPFGGIYMYGKSKVIRTLDRYVEKRLGIPTRNVNLVTGKKFHLTDTLSEVLGTASFDLALGLAMRRVTWL